MKKTKSVAVRITMLLVVSGLLFSIFGLRAKLNGQAQEMSDLSDRLSVLKLHNEQLTIWNNSPIDRDYIIRIAREQGFRMPNETLFYNDLAK